VYSIPHVLDHVDTSAAPACLLWRRHLVSLWRTIFFAAEAEIGTFDQAKPCDLARIPRLTPQHLYTMAAEVQPIAPVRAAPGPAPLTADQAYWRTFKSQLLVPSPHNGAITSITTGANDTFAVTSGGRVQIFSSRTRKLIKTISRFGVDDVARSGVLRRDGRIVLAGGESGVVQAFDTGSRAILKQFMREEKRRQAVHVVRWRPDVLTEFMTCSDDRSVKVWDLTEDEPKFTGLGHEDYVRAGTWLPGQEGMLVTGSYDQTVRVWDTRQAGGRAVMVFKVAGAVEDVLALSPSTIAVAAGNEVSILNLISGKPEVILRSHQKTVTSLSLAQNNTRLLTAGLDGHVKIHSTSSWEVVASTKYTAPILSLTTVPSTSADSDDRHLAVGLQTGLLSIKTRLAGVEKVKSKEKEKRMQALMEGKADEYERKQKKKDLRQGIQARDRGKDFRGEGADIVITGNERNTKAKKLKPWQQSLRKGAYGNALDQVLSPAGGPDQFSNEEVLTLLTALRHRSALRTALANRSEEQLAPVLEWVLKYINHPRLMTLTSDVLLVVLDLYSYRMGDWTENAAGDEGRRICALVERIGKRVRRGCELAQQAESVVGVLELLSEG
jgi:U3 small nucleolar RNA-associated protein 15